MRSLHFIAMNFVKKKKKREKTRISSQAQPEECRDATICKIHLPARRKYLTNFAPRFPHNRAGGIPRRDATFYTPQGPI